MSALAAVFGSAVVDYVLAAADSTVADVLASAVSAVALGSLVVDGASVAAVALGVGSS